MTSQSADKDEYTRVLSHLLFSDHATSATLMLYENITSFFGMNNLTPSIHGKRRLRRNIMIDSSKNIASEISAITKKTRFVFSAGEGS